jgi:hypothetical protein
MSRSLRSIGILLVGLSIIAFAGCKSGSSVPGKRVKEPFTGAKYESNSKWFRGIGRGTSVKQNIARSKSDHDAKNQLAGQVSTNMRAVVDQYLGSTENAENADIADKFQSLVREVMSTELADLRKIGEETYFDDTKETYAVYTAYEIKKNAMFRYMKKQARTDKKVDKLTRDKMEEILDEEIRKSESDD